MAERGLGGGQFWAQPGWPCFSYYIVFLGGDQWCLIGRPDTERGCIATTNPEGATPPIYTREEIMAHFQRYGFVCRGQLVDVIDAEYVAALPLAAPVQPDRDPGQETLE
jgi:hypothetical protein